MAIMRTRHRRERRYAITLRSGNLRPTLTIGAGKLRLEFIRAEIVDRDPVFGIGMCHWPATIRTAVGRLRMGSRCSYGTSDRARP